MGANIGTAGEWQALISKLSGVYAAHVVFSETQEPTEIHVLASSRRAAKALVRDVQSAVSARYGVEVDYHIISVAQIAPSVLSGVCFRLTYSGIDTHTTEKGVEVCVSLRRDGEVFTGTARGGSFQFSRMRCIAQATLDAVKVCTGGTAFFELASTELVRSNGRAIVITQVFCIPDLTPLIGCVFAEPDNDAAVAQSVLDAINRRLEIYQQEM
jgi:hypothetical protein